ncbi:MAG: 6-phosphogluconolactonase [Phycisphaerae bacterium]|nr:6-phosphogluconolactonase [Phycisphaerales bacterium]
MFDAGDVLLPPPPRRPTLPGTVIVRPAFDDLIDAILADMLLQAQSCVRAFGDFHLAISAAEQMEPVLIRLMLDPLYRSLPWKRTHLWTADDCVVSVEDDRSRAKRLREILVEHSDIPIDQVHGIAVTADDPGGEYQDELRETLAWREKGQDRLDYALLSLGGGGPSSAALLKHPSTIAPDPGELVLRRPWKDDAGLAWYGLSPRMLSATRLIAVVAAGDDARPAIADLEAGHRTGKHAGSIRPIGGELRWYLDQPACPDETPADGAPR